MAFYWGLIIGLFCGANIGVIIAGLLFRAKQEEKVIMEGDYENKKCTGKIR